MNWNPLSLLISAVAELIKIVQMYMCLIIYLSVYLPTYLPVACLPTYLPTFW